jgi:MarR family transcriptional regulator, transcriptional regulator for hemolysin
MARRQMSQVFAGTESRKRIAATRLTVIARQLWQRFDRSVGAIGVSRAQWRLIAVVSRRPGATQRLVAEVLEVSEVTAGRLIDRLCAEGYLERRECATDRRARSIHLTPAAQPVLDRLGELARVEEDEAFAGIDAADLDRLEALLDRIARNVASARGGPARAMAPDAEAALALPEATLDETGASA